MTVNYTSFVDREFAKHDCPKYHVRTTIYIGLHSYRLDSYDTSLTDEQYVKKALEQYRLERDPCEWNPETNSLATDADEPHGYAEFVVGAKGQFRLCAKCAALARFKKYRKRSPVEYVCQKVNVIDGSAAA